MKDPEAPVASVGDHLIYLLFICFPTFRRFNVPLHRAAYRRHFQPGAFYRRL